MRDRRTHRLLTAEGGEVEGVACLARFGRHRCGDERDRSGGSALCVAAVAIGEAGRGLGAGRLHPAQVVIGGLVFAVALWMFRRTHKDLGRNWSVTLEVREQHRLVTEGVYNRVRHPMYAAFWLWALAQAFLLPNWIAGPAGLIGFGILFFMRVGREEQMMIDTFGDEYRAYMRRTARVLPGIY